MEFLLILGLVLGIGYYVGAKDDGRTLEKMGQDLQSSNLQEQNIRKAPLKQEVQDRFGVTIKGEDDRAARN